MAFGTGVTAKILPVFFDGVIDVDDANASVARADLLSYFRHLRSPRRFYERVDG